MNQLLSQCIQCCVLAVVLINDCQAQGSSDTLLKLSILNRTIDLSASVDESDRIWLTSRKLLRVGITSTDYPPFTIIDSNHELQGITAEYLLALQRALNMDIELRSFTTREQAYTALSRGEIDLVGAGTKIEAHNYGALLSNAYAYTRIALYSKTGALLDINLSDPGVVIESPLVS